VEPDSVAPDSEHPQAAEGELVAVLSRLQALLISQPVAGEAVQELAEITGHLVPHATAASASMLGAEGAAITTGATDPVAEAADAAQFDLGEGPALDTWATMTLERLDDTATDTRWPAFDRAMAEVGVRCALAAPLVLDGEVLGVVKAYATTPHAFSAADEQTLRLLATAASAVLGAGQHPSGTPRLSAALRTAVIQQHTVDLATGVLMERHQLAEEPARRLLEDTASTGQHSLGEAARKLLARPGQPPPSEAPTVGLGDASQR
jgi:GAF domain-containing protein